MRRRLDLAVVAAAVVGLAVLLIGATKWVAPFLDRPRAEVVSTPGLPGLFQRKAVTVRAGEEACFGDVLFTPDVRQARIRVAAARAPVPPLVVSARARGYRAEERVSDYPAGEDALVTAELAPPQRRVEGELCVRPDGSAVDLVGTDEGRSLVLPSLRIDGKEVPSVDIELTFFSGEQPSLASDPSLVVDRAAELTGAPVWLAWLVAFGMLVVAPLAALAALLLSALRRLPRLR